MTTTRQDTTEPRRATDIARWDLETDVAVVGLGAAGASAALDATGAGADVLVLEGAGAGGGTSAMAGGLIYLGGGTPVQTGAGFEDSAEDMFAFLMAASGPEPDEAKVRVYCDDSVDHYHWLVEQGVPFLAEFYPEPGMEPPGEQGLVYTGGEDAWPFDRIARPAPRGHKPRHTNAAGAFLMECLLAAVDRSPARVVYDTRVLRLVVDDDRRVLGLVARQEGRELTVRARGGVVLCAGGFINNAAMVARHSPQLARCELKLGTDFDDGRAIRMAQAVGATTIRMDSGEVALPVTPPRSLVAGILVNARGQRFINEDTYYGRIGQEALFHEDGQAFLIVDEELYQPTRAGLHASWVCETAEELGAEIGLPPGALESTLELYNRYAADGEDPQFHKAADFLRPLTGPLGAFDFRVENPGSFYATFTLGGLHTDVDGRVLTPDAEPIAGLYAAGRTTSGIAAHGYASGISLGDGTYFGRRAGRAAAAATADRP